MQRESVVQPRPRAWLEASILRPYVLQYGEHLQLRRYAPSPSYSRRSSIWCIRGFWDLGAHGFVRLFHRLTTDTFANALEG